MGHLITVQGVQEEFKTQFGSRLRGFIVKVVFSFLVPCIGIAQVNPWESNKSGSNPWGANEKTEEAQPVKRESAVLENQQSLEILQEQIVIDIPVASVTSTSSKIFFLEGDTVDFRQNENDAYILKYLEDYAYEKQNTVGYFAAGMVGGFFFNILASPVLPVIGIPESAQGRATATQFQKSNPLASEEALKAIKKGSRKKRLKKIFLGTLAGAATQVALFFTLIIL